MPIVTRVFPGFPRKFVVRLLDAALKPGAVSAFPAYFRSRTQPSMCQCFLISGVLPNDGCGYAGAVSICAGTGRDGGARGGGTSSGAAGALCSLSRRWTRILSMTTCSSMQAIALTGPLQRAQVSTSMLNTRFNRCAQVMEAWRSVGEEPSRCCFRWSPLPRPAGVISARQ